MSSGETTPKEWTIEQVARSAGVTSRTLRHYDQIGLLPPARVEANGYRHYDVQAVSRLQRILLLRRMGLSLTAIAEVLDQHQDEQEALAEHIRLLEAERARLDQQISAVRYTLTARRSGTIPSLEMMLDGFNDRYREVVTARWGAGAYAAGHSWWHTKTAAEQEAWRRETDELIADWVRAWRQGTAADTPRAQNLARRHVAWLGQVPGTPVAEGDRERSIEMVRGLGSMYVQDPQFAATYGGVDGAAFVRDALQEFTRVSM